MCENTECEGTVSRAQCEAIQYEGVVPQYTALTTQPSRHSPHNTALTTQPAQPSPLGTPIVLAFNLETFKAADPLSYSTWSASTQYPSTLFALKNLLVMTLTCQLVPAKH